ncbi:YceI family protein [Cupriavidus plantarum]|uniref:Polyisoprenoid-binding protein YceI n=1 Tax=Cupriavidus plantarum TaxID=942865 RepID=A0A316EWS2_9BURK|nr:YceI family protein [Cupriavidus plantarum]NYH99071.1 polyisoprenoid-binding protein YceI [Cupriavidus plantarum]PWK36295.1 polyisoprenoid-binding protein YceI [Cupriavidus plantarum]REF02952.1 polyisoprenoid-binding protein YceI [Cupriavidus plantarum]RLK44183.1 polyisoprenoid-binding protein YceI [Cupriavidus plantarum]CAG2141899.1 Protein YceI [Cupriavidus plantarum]
MTSITRRGLRPLVTGVAGLAAAASLASVASLAWAQVDTAKSAVTATARQIGVPMEGKFRKFDATVDFDPNKLATSSAKIEIDVSSFEIGDAETSKEVKGREWFDAAKYPKATFQSTSIKSSGAGKLDVAGKLTIKGKTVDVVVPATYRQDAAGQVFDGVLPIKRTAFNIGEGEWKDTSVVADDVQIKFHIVTAKKG